MQIPITVSIYNPVQQRQSQPVVSRNEHIPSPMLKNPKIKNNTKSNSNNCNKINAYVLL